MKYINLTLENGGFLLVMANKISGILDIPNKDQSQVATFVFLSGILEPFPVCEPAEEISNKMKCN